MNPKAAVSMAFTALVIFLGVIVCILPYRVEAEAATSGAKVLFILDASGSMWGKVEGKEKIVVAREVMANLINELPDGTQVGLEAYGHRKQRGLQRHRNDGACWRERQERGDRANQRHQSEGQDAHHQILRSSERAAQGGRGRNHGGAHQRRQGDL